MNLEDVNCDGQAEVTVWEEQNKQGQVRHIVQIARQVYAALRGVVSPTGKDG